MYGYYRSCLSTHSHSRNLVPVTQLYVSVDASTKESLKRIDRPLFRDFWPRFISSLEALAEKVSIYTIIACNEGLVLIQIASDLIFKGSKDSLSVDSCQGVEY